MENLKGAASGPCFKSWKLASPRRNAESSTLGLGDARAQMVDWDLDRDTQQDRETE